MGFCSEECFNAACHNLLVKDVDWDLVKIYGKNTTYKEIRSLVKNQKMSLEDAKTLVTAHLKKKLGKNQFTHKVSQKE